MSELSRTRRHGVAPPILFLEAVDRSARCPVRPTAARRALWVTAPQLVLLAAQVAGDAGRSVLVQLAGWHPRRGSGQGDQVPRRTGLRSRVWPPGCG
jgi:hypothetical protein